MNELALFAGAGGGIIGGKLLGWRTVCAVEFDAHARNVLVARQNDGSLETFPIWDDVRTFDGRPWRGIVDVISGGFPCQDISISNRNAKGIDGARSRLYSEMLRIIREVQPRYAFMENSAALTFRGLGTVLGDLAEMGYDAKWGCLRAFDAGGNHNRDRIWIVSYPESQYVKSSENKNRNREHRLPLKPGRVSWWQTEPGFCRVVDGVADRVDKRNYNIGNGQVPAVAALAWNILTSANPVV
jgi:DNA (cytosine-5)-methyltransferase 1